LEGDLGLAGLAAGLSLGGAAAALGAGALVDLDLDQAAAGRGGKQRSERRERDSSGGHVFPDSVVRGQGSALPTEEARGALTVPVGSRSPTACRITGRGARRRPSRRGGPSGLRSWRAWPR